MHSVFTRLQLRKSRADKVEEDKLKEEKEARQISFKSEVKKKADDNYGISKDSSDDEDPADNKWRLELAWLTKALEPALQFCRWAMPTGMLTLKHVSFDEVRQQEWLLVPFCKIICL